MSNPFNKLLWAPEAVTLVLIFIGLFVIYLAVGESGERSRAEYRLWQQQVAEQHCQVAGYVGKYAEPYYKCDDGLRKYGEVH